MRTSEEKYRTGRICSGDWVIKLSCIVLEYTKYFSLRGCCTLVWNLVRGSQDLQSMTLMI